MSSIEHLPVGARTYRASTGIAVLVVCAALSVFLLGDAVIRGSWALMLLYAPWVLLVLWLIYELSVVSRVRVDEEGVVVQNFLRRTSFGWRRVTDLDLRWQLDFHLEDGRKLSCWGGPGRIQSPRMSRTGDEIRIPASLRTLGEVRARWEHALEQEKGADAPIRRSWDWPAIGALVVIAAGAVIAIVVTR
ncbi:PH domain-containing protein [Microbacterium sp. 22242]|uniref:PH domain-containing protein n=1 Tax=Microbacterium sp. 22242 TaxID=3453896 RepID=UPI003F827C86